MADSKKSDDLSCDEARAQVHDFLGVSSVGAKSPELRAHLAGCLECDAYYREQVVGVARIASGARVAADQRHEDEVSTSARRSLIAAETRLRFKLPKAILPLAVVALIAVLVMKSGSQTMTLRALEGTVYRGVELVEHGKAIPAENGAACSTGVDGRAQLERGDDALSIEPASSFTVERTDRLAIRLFDGRVNVMGSALIVFSSGALEVERGSARVTVDDVGITIEAVSGTVEYSDARGRALIRPGATTQIEHVHVAATR